jgi:C1A family cysteine protease
MHELWRKLTNLIMDSPMELGGFKLTAFPSPPDKRDFNFKWFAGNKPLPKRFIRRDEMPSVMDQGKYGICVSAASWGVKMWQERQQKNLPPSGLSKIFVYSLCKKLDGLRGQPGTYPRVAAKVLQEYGICSEAKMPFSMLTDDRYPPEPPQEAYEEAKKFRVQNYARIDNIEDIKRAIVEQGPVMGGLLVCDNFIEPENGFLDMPEGYVRGAHEVVFCGFDDDLIYTYKSGVTRKGFILMLNSWGNSWGLSGYSWLPYDYITSRTEEGIPYFYEAWAFLDLPYQLKRFKKALFKVGDNKAIIDGNIVTLDQPPFITDSGRTVVPLRFFTENCGYIVNWQKDTRIIEVYDPSTN